jgi:integrating conjugative element protein (TIGR03752 family)
MTKNKLIPILFALAALMVGYVLIKRFTGPKDAPVAAGAPMQQVPRPGVDPASAPSAGILGGRSALPPVRSADADNTDETLATVIASNRQLREDAAKVLADNKQLQEQVRQAKAAGQTPDQIRDAVIAELQAKGALRRDSAVPTAEASKPSATPAVVDAGVAAATRMIEGVAGVPQIPPSGTGGAPRAAGVPAGLGYDQAISLGGGTKTITPMGYATPQGAQGGLQRTTLAAAAHTPIPAADPVVPTSAAGAGVKPEPVPYFTIPENATLAQTTAMTTLVGRVPIDGTVQDPMQFKLVVGRENLAASGHQVPDDIEGVIVSGIAIGDMALSCTEGLIQSLTFVFQDGTIRTVSMRKNGASVNFAGGGGGGGGMRGGGQGLTQAQKLGWISDEFGNPCVPGKFVTNAPQYLTDLIGAKSISVAGAAVAAAQTTVTNSSSAIGSATATQVTGDRGKYVLGKTVSGGSDEITNWLIRRLNNSFDAVVVRAGAKVAIHIDQSIEIDKEPDGRKLDYMRGGATLLTKQRGAIHGLP